MRGVPFFFAPGGDMQACGVSWMPLTHDGRVAASSLRILCAASAKSSNPVRRAKDKRAARI